MLKQSLFYLFPFLLLLCNLPAVAQKSIRVSGTVLQSDRSTPIPGATVVKVNSKLGVLTDENGQFKIDVAQQDTLLIRAVGFKPVLYLPNQLPVSELRVNIIMNEDSVLLGEVEITSRPSQEMIQRALRNMKRQETSQVKKPGYIPGLEPPPPPPAPAPSIGSPATLLYDMLSKEGKEKRKLNELLKQQELERQRKEREEYNKLFKNNTGYQ